MAGYNNDNKKLNVLKLSFLNYRWLYIYSIAGGAGGGGGGGGGNLPYLFSKYAGFAFQTLIRIFCVIPFFVNKIIGSSLVCFTTIA